jgi:flagella basal body P-ring formation protein FlgA
MNTQADTGYRGMANARTGTGCAPGMAMKIVLGLVALCGLATACHASTAQQSHASILQTAQSFLQQQLKAISGRSEIRLGQLDPRLRLAPCDGKLQAFLPAGSTVAGNTSVGVQCTGTTAWKIYVPAQIVIIDRVVISRGFIPRGTVLTREHLTIAEREINAASQGYLKDMDAALGMKLKHPIREGLVITPVMLERPALVKRGDEVTILSRSNSLEVRMKGSALANGAEGDRIRVRNLNSSRIVEGVVRADGAVVVQM